MNDLERNLFVAKIQYEFSQEKKRCPQYKAELKTTTCASEEIVLALDILEKNNADGETIDRTLMIYLGIKKGIDSLHTIKNLIERILIRIPERLQAAVEDEFAFSFMDNIGANLLIKESREQFAERVSAIIKNEPSRFYDIRWESRGLMVFIAGLEETDRVVFYCLLGHWLKVQEVRVDIRQKIKALKDKSSAGEVNPLAGKARWN